MAGEKREEDKGKNIAGEKREEEKGEKIAEEKREEDRGKQIAEENKIVFVVGIDETEYGYYALEWTLDHFFVPFPAQTAPYYLIVLHVITLPTSSADSAQPGAANAQLMLDLNRRIDQVAVKVHKLCNAKSVTAYTIEVVEGDVKSILCEAAERHKAIMLIVGSHASGPLNSDRAVLGSICDYCIRHAPNNVMIVKIPKPADTIPPAEPKSN